MVNFDGEVRRIDFNLRTECVDIDTVIYKIADDSYELFSEQFKDDIELYEEKFKKVRFFTTPLKLVSFSPDKFIAIIPSINDQAIAHNFEGLPMNMIGFYNLLLAKFPDINIYKVEGAQPIIVHVYAPIEKTSMGTVVKRMGNKQRDRLMNFLVKLKIATNFLIVEDEVTELPELNRKLVENPVHYLNANKLWNKEIGEFTDRDETLWFDRIDDIFQGTFKKENLYFYEAEDYPCYIDYTSGGHIDIRNFLLLYKTLYITPYEKDIKKWLAEQRITEDEFLQLIAKNRIKIVLSQPEFRYKMDLFREAYENIAKLNHHPEGYRRFTTNRRC